MPLLEAMGATVVTTTVTMPMEEVATVVTTVAMAALLKATMAMVAMEAALLVVSLCTVHGHCQCLGSMSLYSKNNTVYTSLCYALMALNSCTSPLLL